MKAARGHCLKDVSESSELPRGGGKSQRTFSLRLRLILLATLMLIVALGLVGIALNAANERSAVSALRDRMESSVYLVLAAADVNDSGNLVMQSDLGDPRLNQPGSGIYVHLHGGVSDSADHWSSPSALGLQLPELAQFPSGVSRFSEPSDDLVYFSFQYGVSFQSENVTVKGDTVPFSL